MQPIEFLKHKTDRLEVMLIEIRKEINRMELKGLRENYDIKRLISDEKYRIRVALTECKTNSEAAKLLQISERTLYRKMLNYGIQIDRISFMAE